MATIGTFTPARDGFLQGSIRTLTLDTPAQLEPIHTEAEGAPAYRVYAGEIELGAAWAKVGRDSGRAYHQVRLDDPSFPAPIFANLITDPETGTYSLIWSRPKTAARSARNARSNGRGRSRPEAKAPARTQRARGQARD